MARLKARIELKNGNFAYLAGRYDAAIHRYDKALAYVPQLAPACLNRAYSQEALFRLSSGKEERRKLAMDAVASFQAYQSLLENGALGLDAKAPDAQRVEEHILTLLVDSGQADQAVAHLEGRVTRNPRDTSALEMLSRLEMEAGRLDRAMDWQRKRVAVEPDNPDAQYSLGAFTWLRSYRDASLDPTGRNALLDEGMTALQRALQLRQDDFETLIYINLLYIEKAKCAHGDAERAAFEAQAKTYRDRALASRKSTTERTSDAPETNPAPSGGQGSEPQPSPPAAKTL